ncbi:MAG: YrdC/Sua5 family protein, required for threonylcarbamoyladenosine (T(6)A) formation in tRNA [Candidatus Magasanikbacteria bacterium GW2011_GWA2_56_11]|uniref:L-threonylcarbamoyladenylate synthase n=1 Tax=Candidatus Magasanikbacteria bacterium GW2011_GWA2_56_11 TaxID=1619044 RepID=A0A0G2BA04_9BACT|nr:MAG: YrdC/Sua5 family protein, required for threonylcarbamoyladenosine (T(6)A) formation in tRNA [Candidatus Magasanikbacteria bacterium GW2011_GWA2_56_11]
MRIIKVDNISFSELVSALRRGETLVYPTETCYGLGCDATNGEAVGRVFAIKQRVENKPLLVVVPDIAMILDYVVWTPALERLARKYWPGPLTVVTYLQPEVRLPAGVAGPDGTIAFRVTSHPVAAELSRGLGAPLVSTSANISGGANPYTTEAVLEIYRNAADQPDIIIEAGSLSEKSPSTIVRVEGESITVIRQGEIVVS